MKKHTTRQRGSNNTKKEIKTVSDLPTTTAHQSRLRLFQATRRPVRGVWEIETAWGKVKISGRLGQTHADVLDAMLYTAEKVGLTPDGRIKLLVDFAKVRSIARQKSGKIIKTDDKTKNRIVYHSSLEYLVDDLMGAVVEVMEPKHLAEKGHIIDHIYMAVDSNGIPLKRPNPLGGSRNLRTVIFGTTGTKFLKEDLGVKYNPSGISRLRHGGSQAVARIVLTHTDQPNGGWHLDTLIAHICGNITEQELWNRRREIKKDAVELSKIGIIINNDKVSRT